MPQDLRFALRLCRKRPAWTAVIVGVLALGIGANTAMFTAFDAWVLRPLDFHEPDRLATLKESHHGRRIQPSWRRAVVCRSGRIRDPRRRYSRYNGVSVPVWTDASGAPIPRPAHQTKGATRLRRGQANT